MALVAPASAGGLRSGARCASWSGSGTSGVSGSRRWERVAGARGVVGVKSGVSCGGGSELSRTARSVARRAMGLIPAGVDSEGDGEGMAGVGGGWRMANALEGVSGAEDGGRDDDDDEGTAGAGGRGGGGRSMCMRDGSESEAERGELRTASRTGSKAGMVMMPI